jgi:putative ubiquitin-RnfH superfamily antitoxin RatB of RatAB toxin-antitoxin module
MNPTNFTYILQNPQAITHSQTEVVKSIIDEFPYFQSARSIYLKGLKNENSFKYNQELKITAAYTTDRSILFDFITSEVFIQNEISQFIKQNTEHLKDIEIDVEDISINKSIQIDDALRQQIKDTINVFDPILFEPKEERQKNIASFVLDESKTIEPVTEDSKTQEASANDLLNLGKPLEFDRKETHSFNEWLKLARFSPIERLEDSAKESTELKTSSTSDKFKLIDKFITENPKIKPLKISSSKVNLAEAQMIQPEALMTETLARIYVEQKNYKKAIQSYKILSLKYPEKSSSFANQIKAIEQLQEQNNKK